MKFRENKLFFALLVNLYMFGTTMFQGSQIRGNSYPEAVIGGFIGTIVSGFIAMKFGRKIPLLFIFISTIVSDKFNLNIDFRREILFNKNFRFDFITRILYISDLLFNQFDFSRRPLLFSCVNVT